MDNEQKLILELEKLQECWINILELYDDIEEHDDKFPNEFAKGYPFENSFDEYYLAIDEWILILKEYFEGGN